MANELPDPKVSEYGVPEKPLALATIDVISGTIEKMASIRDDFANLASVIKGRLPHTARTELIRLAFETDKLRMRIEQYQMMKEMGYKRSQRHYKERTWFKAKADYRPPPPC